MPIEPAMGQASLLHDGVEPDAVEPLLAEQARGRFHNPRSALSSLLACHAHRGPIPPTGIAPGSVRPSQSGGRVIDCSCAILPDFTAALAASTAEIANEGVERGCEEEAEAGDAQHPKQHRRAE